MYICRRVKLKNNASAVTHFSSTRDNVIVPSLDNGVSKLISLVVEKNRESRPPLNIVKVFL